VQERVQERQPVFNVPGAVLAILLAMIAVHTGRQLLDEQSGMWWLVALAFIPARYAGLAGELPGGDAASVTSWITHMFVHADMVHLIINSAWLLAFGSVICRRVGTLRFFAFTIASGIAGALLFLVIRPGLFAPVVGASGAVAGLMGGVMRFLFSAIDNGQGRRLSDRPAEIPAMSLRTALTDRRILSATAAFVALNLLAIFGFGAFGTGATIAWEAHLGGYFFGLLCFGFFDIAPQHTSPLPTKIE
jgi:membrane associated rhomboid family serine protease